MWCALQKIIFTGYFATTIKYLMIKEISLQMPSFFSVFDFNIIKGNATNPFPDNNSVVITQSTAKKYFGE